MSKVNTKFAYLYCQFVKARWNAEAKFSLVKPFFETVPAQIICVATIQWIWNMSEAKSEVFLWLRSISNGLGLERLAVEFESWGFRKTSSLKYIRSSDLDVLFPSPHKLLLAEKRIIETELEQLKRQENPGRKAQTLPPRELFPSFTQGSRGSSVSSPTQASNLVLFNNVYSPTAWPTPALSAQILKVKLLKRKKLRKFVIKQVLIFRSGKHNLSKMVSFWLHRY